MESSGVQGASIPSSSQGSSRRSSYNSQSLKEVKPRYRIMVTILCFVHLLNYMDRFTVAGVLQEVQDYYKIHNEKGGLLQTVFIITYMIFAPLFGYLGDRCSRKNIITAGVLLWSLTTLVGSFMKNYWLFLLLRSLVGIGEASYSTVAPTIISDSFANHVRSIMLAFFCFSVPVGCGLGYSVGSEVAKLLGAWQWSLRVTPSLGGVAALLVFFFVKNPPRGASDGSADIATTPWTEDMKDLLQNRSFLLVTAGGTCVSFAAGALAWWGAKLLSTGLKLQKNVSTFNSERSTLVFGIITMISGVSGLSLGSYLSYRFREKYPRIDPILCSVGLLTSAPLTAGAIYSITYDTTLCYTLLFLGLVGLCLNWAIIYDLLLYVVLPTRRSTAEGFHLLVIHALGDSGSPYVIGLLSEIFFCNLDGDVSKSDWNEFKGLQYALLVTCCVNILGAIFFAICTYYVMFDKLRVEKAIHETSIT